MHRNASKGAGISADGSNFVLDKKTLLEGRGDRVSRVGICRETLLEGRERRISRMGVCWRTLLEGRKVRISRRVAS